MKRFAVLAILGLALYGCAPMQQYRTNYAPCTATGGSSACAASAIQEFPAVPSESPGYQLGVVEFDDQGKLFDRGQMQAVLGSVSKAAAEQDVLIVVFVHGWKHSAQEGDGNLDQFRAALERLSETELALSTRIGVQPRRVVGVYFGWRGLSLSMPVLRELTFWDRKNTAHRVGHGEVTEVLERLDLIRRIKDAQADGGLSRSRLVVIGHSFGGAVVFSALEQIMAARFVATRGPVTEASDVEGFGNLVVLVNPAFEALLFAPLSDMANERATYFPRQLPVLAILTSEADSATGKAFPIGRFFSTLFETERDEHRANPISHHDDVISERAANVDAVGHFEPYRTHYLRPAPSAGPGAPPMPRAAQRAESVLRAAEDWEHDAPGSHIAFPGVVLERTPDSAARNPYLVVKVHSDLISDHNDIWDARVQDFVAHLILIAGQSGNYQERTLQRKKALK